MFWGQVWCPSQTRHFGWGYAYYGPGTCITSSRGDKLNRKSVAKCMYNDVMQLRNFIFAVQSSWHSRCFQFGFLVHHKKMSNTAPRMRCEIVFLWREATLPREQHRTVALAAPQKNETHSACSVGHSFCDEREIQIGNIANAKIFFRCGRLWKTQTYVTRCSILI